MRCPSEPGKFWEPVLYHSAEVEYALCCGLHDKFDSSVAFDIWSHNDALHHEDYDLVPDSKQVRLDAPTNAGFLAHPGAQ